MKIPCHNCPKDVQGICFAYHGTCWKFRLWSWLSERRKIVANKIGEIIETIKNGKMNRVFSCCGEDFTQLTMWMKPNYCPNCGAKMKKKIVEAWKNGSR